MIKFILWPIKVNIAIAGFGISPTSFSGVFRSEVQSLGMNADLTAQETALILVSLGVSIHYGNNFDLILNTLRHEGKIDINKPEIVDALYEMGYGVDPWWEWDAIMIYRKEYDEEDLVDMHDYAKSPIAQIFARLRWNRVKDHVEQSERRD